jgi:beta-lactamase regulating signal transducer with metallopeptidase domain
MDVILLIWGIGSLVMLFNTVRVLLKDRNFRKRYRIANNMRAVIIARELKLKRAEIVVSPDVVVPYVIGLLRARIFLPDIDMDENTLTLILKHEYQHFKSRDLFTKMFYLLLSIVFWWNPISHVFLREIDCLLEVRCDAAMTKRMSEGEKTQYMESLLYIARHIQATDTKAPVNILSFARMEQRGFIMQRFSFIQSSKSVKHRVKQIFPVVVVVMFFLVSFFIEVQPNYREYSRPYTPMRQLTDEELEQRGLLGDITSIDTGDGEILIIVQDAQRSFTDLSEAQGGALRPGTHSTPENSP